MSEPDVTPIVISAEMQALCARLGLPYEQVRWIHFEPTTVTAVVLQLNAQGKPWMKPNGDVASEELRFRVRS